MTFDELLQKEKDFDLRIELLRKEGIRAYFNGISKSSCPYQTNQEKVIWTGGWAEAALGVHKDLNNG